MFVHSDKIKTHLISIAILAFALAGCESYQQHAADRTEKLREIYPTGMSKREVQAKWEPIKPDFSASRPFDGWDSNRNTYIAKKLNEVESRTGKKIESTDRYWGADGLSSLCYCWYFYDSNGRIVDVEWQYKSD